jgi:hypothetical protein
MKLSSAFFLLFTGLALATPLEARAGTEDPAVLDEAVAADPALVLLDEPQSGEAPGQNDTTVPVARGIQARAITKLQWEHNPWTFSIKATGSHLIVFQSNGYVRFKTHFRATGFWTYKYGIACGLRDKAGRAYSLSRSGTIHGTNSFGSRNHDVDQTRFNAAVKAHWDDIVNGNRRMQCKVRMANSLNPAALLKLLGEVIDILKTWGPVVASVIAIF